jgi:hypothetical protein
VLSPYAGIGGIAAAEYALCAIPPYTPGGIAVLSGGCN